MDPAIGCEHFTVSRMIGLAGKIRDHPTGFLHEQHSCRRVPGLQSKFPEGLEATRRDAAKIERSRSVTPDTVRSKRVTGVISDVCLLATLIRGKSCNEQAGCQGVDLRNVDAIVA